MNMTDFRLMTYTANFHRKVKGSMGQQDLLDAVEVLNQTVLYSCVDGLKGLVRSIYQLVHIDCKHLHCIRWDNYKWRND